MAEWEEWQPEEEADLLAGMEYHTFKRKYPRHASRPNYQIRNKRNRLKRRERKRNISLNGVVYPAMGRATPDTRVPFGDRVTFGDFQIPDRYLDETRPMVQDQWGYPSEPPPAWLAGEPTPTITGATADVEPDIDAIRTAAEQKFAAKQRRAVLKNQQHVHFPAGPIALFFVGDQHIGNTGTDVARMFHEQDLILATPSSYVVLMGDTVDNYIVGKLMAENMNAALNVWEQWELAKHYLTRWGTRIIGQNSGNHSQWATKMIGVDYDREISPKGTLYDADELRFSAHVGRHAVRIRTRHKWRGNSMHNPSHALERAAKFDTPDFDVFVGAHVHQGATAREFIHNGKRKLALMSSTYKGVDGYQRQEGFTENDASTAVALVINEDGSMFGTSNLQSVLHYMQAIAA